MASNYQLGYDDERFDTIIDRHFHCLICYNVLKDPVMCRRNQHYFCRGCITEHLRRNSHTCPTCADELTVDILTNVPRIVTDYLDERKIRCDYEDRGCRELVQLQNLSRHVAECGFSPVVCGNQGCGQTISKRDRTYHESELCQFRKLKCHNCEEISTMIAGMDTKVTNLDTKMTLTDTKVNNINTKLNNMDTKLVNVDVNEKLNKMEANIDKKMTLTDTKIANLGTKMAQTDMKLETMNTEIANLETNVKARFEAVSNEVRGMRMSLNEMKDGFDHLKEAVLEKIKSKERKQEEITRDVSGAASGGRENQHIFVAGGQGRKSVEIFNYPQKLWSLLKPMPEDRFKASSFVYNNHVTLAGGLCRSPVDNMIRMNIHPIPDLSINWSNFAAKLPVKMHAYSSVVYKNSLIVTGGYDADQSAFSDCIRTVELIPPYTVKLLSKMPEPIVCHSTTLCDDSILIFGGKKTASRKDNLHTVLSYDIKNNECQQLPELPYPVSEMATVKWGENVVIIGGADKDDKALNNVIIYNVKTGNSHMLPPMLHKRYGSNAVVIENTIVVLGGRDEKWNNLKSVEGFSFDRYTWEELPDMKEGRSFATAVVI